VKAFVRRRDGEPGGGEAQEGIGLAQRLTAEATATDSQADKSPEVETTVRGGGGNTVSGSAATSRGHDSDVDETARLPARKNPWRANPGRGCGVKQTHEPGGGESRRGREKRRGRKGFAGLGPSGHGRRPVMSRRGTADPKEGAGGGDTDGGHETADSEGERSSRGDEAASVSKRRTASGGHRQSCRKRRGHSGPGEPNDPGRRTHIKTLQSSEPHERQHGRR